jgi:hypothetical protein
MEMSSWSNLFGRFITTILLGLFSSQAPVFRAGEATDERTLVGVYAPMRVVHDGLPAPIHESLAIARRAPGSFTLTFSRDGKTALAFDARLYLIKEKGKVPQRYFDMRALPSPSDASEKERIPLKAAHCILPFDLEDGRLDLEGFDADALEASAKKANVPYTRELYQSIVFTASKSVIRKFFFGAAWDAITKGRTLYRQ